MLKKLRLRFVLINMIIVTCMLGSIFGTIYISTSRNLERESLQIMRGAAFNPMPGGLPEEPKRNLRMPYFKVVVNQAGETIKMDNGFPELSDRELLQEIVEKAVNMQADSGVLKAYDLRFLRTELPVGQCFVFTDITGERSMLRSLLKNLLLIGGAAFLVFLGVSFLLARWAVGPADKAWKQQKQFVADASHELKTPLTVIMTDAELLHTAECSERERVQLSGSIITMADQMRGLVESLLELARLDSGQIREAMQKVSFSEIVSDAAMLFEPVFYEGGMAFSYEIEPDVTINGNGTHLKQLAEILLDNAAKYAAPGGKTILTLKKISARKCLLTVSNEGAAIPPDELKKLFRRFYRADKARTRNRSYGLGLSIAESIAAEHHGRIWAESRDGMNRFYVELEI